MTSRSFDDPLGGLRVRLVACFVRRGGWHLLSRGNLGVTSVRAFCETGRTTRQQFPVIKLHIFAELRE